MNTEFEWRNEMRKLGGPVEPARDLWPGIAARIAAQPVPAAPSRRRALGWLALAATLVVAIGAVLTAQRWQQHAPTVVAPPVIAEAPIAPTPTPTRTASADLPHTALDWAVPDDPRLAATAQDLDNASAQLQDALEQRPDAVFLVGLLNRTNAMRLRLMRKSPYAG